MVYDVAILGQGPAGLAAASLLAFHKRNVLLLDRPAVMPYKVGESLPAAVQKLLKTLAFVPLQFPPHSRIAGSDSVWAGERLQEDFIMRAQGEDWRIDRVQFEKDLQKQVFGFGVTYDSTRLQAVKFQNKLWQLYTDNEKRYDSQFVIDASGRNAVFSHLTTIPRVKGPPLVAVCVRIEPTTENAKQKVFDTRTFIESQELGWWYAAHLPDGAKMIVFHTSPSYAVLLRQEPQRWWQQLSTTELIAKKFANIDLGKIEFQTRDARDIHLQQAYGPQWAACGDAALSLDPISSQGIFNAMAGAHMLCQAILQDDHQAGLKRYQQKLNDIFSIYCQRRSTFYQRAYQYYKNEFWLQQVSESTGFATSEHSLP
ncbi:MAG: tryptophan 7-halogenase [Spirochaetota bacterium]